MTAKGSKRIKRSAVRKITLTNKIANALMTMDDGATAKRLILEDNNGKYRGGWCHHTACMQIINVLKEEA